jgi:hypothetical protein
VGHRVPSGMVVLPKMVQFTGNWPRLWRDRTERCQPEFEFAFHQLTALHKDTQIGRGSTASRNG